MKSQDMMSGNTTSLWLFGYGSLVWKPEFKYRMSKVGFIQGYKRRFWHGDNFHRGNDDLPGRVVTLIEDYNSTTWGVAFEATDAQVEESLQYLNVREGMHGGYVTKTVEFFPKGEGGEQAAASVQALVYIATPDNPLFLGPASPEHIGAQIAMSRGKAGHNLDYLFRLANFMRQSCPHVDDPHLFSIEAAALAVVLHLLTIQ